MESNKKSFVTKLMISCYKLIYESKLFNFIYNVFNEGKASLHI